MGPLDPSFASTLSGPARIAKRIVEALVRDLNLRPGDFVYEKSLDQAFEALGLAVEEISGGLERAVAHGWLIFDSDLHIYTLTQTGFTVA